MLGRGEKLFDGGTVPTGFDVVRSRVTPSGVIMTTYRSGAEIKYGSLV